MLLQSIQFLLKELHLFHENNILKSNFGYSQNKYVAVTIQSLYLFKSIIPQYLDFFELITFRIHKYVYTIIKISIHVCMFENDYGRSMK